VKHRIDEKEGGGAGGGGGGICCWVVLFCGSKVLRNLAHARLSRQGSLIDQSLPGLAASIVSGQQLDKRMRRGTVAHPASDTLTGSPALSGGQPTVGLIPVSKKQRRINELRDGSIIRLRGPGSSETVNAEARARGHQNGGTEQDAGDQLAMTAGWPSACINSPHQAARRTREQ